MQKDYEFPADWSAHSLTPVSDLLYMAEAAARASSILCYPWIAEDRLTDAGAAPAPSLVPPEQAFLSDGSPVPEVHVAQSGIVWSYAYFGDFEHPFPAQRASVDQDDWNEAYSEATWLDSSRDTSRRVAGIIADVLTTAAATNRLITFVRPIGGGTAMKDPPEFAWDIDDRLARLARCGLVYDRPGDTDSRPDHLIYFEPSGFDDVIRTFLPTHWTPLLNELAHEPPPGRPSPTERRKMLVDIMCASIQADKKRRWTHAALENAVRASGITDFTMNMFLDARRRAIARTKIETPPGRPKKQDGNVEAPEEKET